MSALKVIAVISLLAGCAAPAIGENYAPQSVLVGKNDYASLWRIDDKQRGVTCYALTGNYNSGAAAGGLDCLKTVEVKP